MPEALRPFEADALAALLAEVRAEAKYGELEALAGLLRTHAEGEMHAQHHQRSSVLHEMLWLVEQRLSNRSTHAVPKGEK